MLTREATLARWQKCKVTAHEDAAYEHLAQRVLTYKATYYDPVALATKIPWWLVAALDMREESFSHSGYLGNGDPLYHVTTHVPRGRGPFKSWYAGAIDALTFDHMTPAKGQGNHWDIVTCLIAAEGYNGLGYASRGLPSPYVWAGTNIQQAGKFVADGKWSPTAWDTQPGCAGLWLALKTHHQVDLNEA